MKTGAAQTLAALDETGSGLALVFQWRDDRWRHVIEVLLQGESRGSLHSLEGDLHSHWPASPPFQQLSVELLEPRRQVGFLVGMAGQNHWSGGVEALPGERALVFDIACRMNAAPLDDDQFLGSSYVADLPFHWQDNTGETLLDRSAKVLFSAAPLPDQTAKICCLEPTRLVCQPSRLREEKKSPRGAAGSSTVRWKYRLALQTAEASSR